MTADLKTVEVYDTCVNEYHAQANEYSHDPYLEIFMRQMPKNANVLDLGCGPGHASAVMKSAGLNPDPVDASPKMVALANESYGVKARVSTFDDIKDEKVYQGVWANYSLLHAPRKDLPRHLNALHKALVPKGLLHLAMKKGEGERRDRLGRYYTYYAADELTEILHASGFTPNLNEENEITGFTGAAEVSLVVHAIA